MEEIASCAVQGKERFKALAALIDDRICSSYRLWDTNYIALDILEGNDAGSSYYTAENRLSFIERMEKGLSAILQKDPDMDKDELREIFLSIYANPVRSSRVHPAGGKGNSYPV